MSILSGRYGKVFWDPTGTLPGTPVEIISLNTWKLDSKIEYEDVTCFGDSNRVYVPGLKDISGTVGGFHNSADLTLWEAADSPTPGTLKLMINNNEPLFYFLGTAYMDASMDASLAAPKITGTFKAAGPWTGPEQTT